jgi:hypothetical protein
MAPRDVDLVFESNGNLTIALTPAGAAFVREDLGLRCDADGRLDPNTQARYERYCAHRAFAELLPYQLGTGWELTSDEVGGLVSPDAQILSESLVRDDRGVVTWWRALYWYADYQKVFCKAER